MVDVLIQTFNEELNLPHTLQSVAGWARHVYVVDSGSTDRTRQIAEARGATVIEHAFEGYAEQKNWALDNVPFESPWVLILDADEAVTPELRDEIVAVTSKPPETVREDGFLINRVLIFFGQKIWHCGYFPSWNLRLLKRGRARYEHRLVHEHMIVNGPVGRFKNLLLHEDRRGMEHFFAKHNRYSTLEAAEHYARPQPWPGGRTMLKDRVIRWRFIKSRVLPVLPAPWFWRFIYMFVFRLGFLDGVAGWRLCHFIAMYESFIRFKYQELQQLKRTRPLRAGALSVPEGRLLSSATAQSPPPLTPTPLIRSPESTVPIIPPAIDEAPPAPAPLDLPTQASHSTTERVPVSVMIPALNEAGNLPRCLDHLRWADEVIVVDSGSKDDTRAIAEAYGAKVIPFQWDGKWPKKKNWALRHAPFKHEWVLIVDADEWIVPELAAEIAEAIKNPRYVGYYVNRRFIFMGRWIRHCGYYPSWNLRLLKRGHGEYERLTEVGDTGSGDNEVHEHVIATGPVEYLKHDMLHFAFPTIGVFMEKHNRYSNWEAAVQFKQMNEQARPSDNADIRRRRALKEFSRRLPFRPLLRFFYAYIWRGGFLDGRPGFIFCRLLAIYEYLSVAKFYEIRRAERDKVEERKLSHVPKFNWRDERPRDAEITKEISTAPKTSEPESVVALRDN